MNHNSIMDMQQAEQSYIVITSFFTFCYTKYQVIKYKVQLTF